LAHKLHTTINPQAEALIPLTLADERSVIIMAGDYRQLGPHLVSPSSKLHGLDKSIMAPTT
jgi:hypothetical protein